MTSVMDNPDKLSMYLNECYEMGISVLPPDINISTSGFVADGRSIRFGLSAIKGIGRVAFDEIMRVREEYGGIQSMHDLIFKADTRKVNKTVMEALIHSGAFDNSGYHRAHLQAALDDTLKALRSYKGRITRLNKRRESIVAEDLEEAAKVLADIEEKRKEAKEIFDQACRDAMNRTVDPYPKAEMYEREKELLGFYISGNPLTLIMPYLDKHATITTDHVVPDNNGKDVVFGGLLDDVRVIKTRNGKTMAMINVRDHTGVYNVSVSPWTYSSLSEIINSDNVGKAVLMRGRISSYSQGSEIITKIDAQSASIITEQDVEEVAMEKDDDLTDLFEDEDEIELSDRLHIMVDGIEHDPKREIESIKQVLIKHKVDDDHEGSYPEIHVLYPKRVMIVPVFIKVPVSVSETLESIEGVVAVVNVPGE